MKSGLVGGLTALAFAATGGAAAAGTYTSSSLSDCGGCTVTVFTSGSTYTPPALPSGLAPLNLGTAGTQGLVMSTAVTSSSIPVALPAGTDITSISFSGGTTYKSGVWAGNTINEALSPFGKNDSTHNYLVAEGGSTATPGEVTIDYSAGQTSFDLLWGTVDTSPDTYNELMFVTGAGQSVTGADLSTFVPLTTAVDDVVVEISGLTSFKTLTAKDEASPAFEFDPLVAVPAPVIGQGLPVALAVGGLLFGVWASDRRKKRRTLGAATA